MHLLASNVTSRRSPIQSSLSLCVDIQGVSLGSRGWITIWRMLHLKVREEKWRYAHPESATCFTALAMTTLIVAAYIGRRQSSLVASYIRRQHDLRVLRRATRFASGVNLSGKVRRYGTPWLLLEGLLKMASKRSQYKILTFSYSQPKQNQP